MIPKIIHFCWLSDDTYPSKIEKCINSWKKFMPDYELIKWDKNKFPLENNIWVRQAYETKKYAFAADYIRLYALYHYGGIYLDSDVEVLRSFDDLLHLPYFMGFDTTNNIEAAVIGVSVGNEWIGECLKYYNNRTFIDKTGKLDTATLPMIMKGQIERSMKFKKVESIEFPNETGEIYLFPCEYFSPKNVENGNMEITENTYSIHHFSMSWLPKNIKIRVSLKLKLMHVIGYKNVIGVIKLLKK
ncbi:MAG: glycosyl transferase [Prevotellaceae bacterium]|jgi:hypothetical protein|nr:glycosyl transferase [Prevotellaceae bacterium]